MALGYWIDLGKKRIMNILDTYVVSSVRHLEIKISEAGPYNQRVEPVALNIAYRQLKKDGIIQLLETDPVEIVGSTAFGKPGDKSRLRKFIRLYNLHHSFIQKDEYCGFQLEKLLYDTSLDCKELYTILGSGPIDDGKHLVKPPNSEIVFYNGNQSYKSAGLDLFLVHKKTNIPIGIEAKNIREWIYPASYEVWRMLAKASLLECLPVLASRKISYISRAGFFSKVGILGFETQFQYFNPRVKAASNYKFADIVKKDGLGYSYIKVTNKAPSFFLKYFSETLPNNLEVYYEQFMKHKNIIKKYAIEEGLADNKMGTKKRRELYSEFRKEVDYFDPELEGPNIEDDEKDSF